MSQSPDPDQEWRPPAPEAPGSTPPSGTDQGGSVRYGAPGVDPEPYGAAPYAGRAADGHDTAHPSTPPAAGGPPTPAWTIVLLVVSGLITLTGLGVLWAAPAGLAIVSLTKNATDPAGARRLARIGWWVAAGLAAATVVLVVLVVIAIALFGLSLPTTSGYDPSTVGLDVVATALAATVAR